MKYNVKFEVQVEAENEDEAVYKARKKAENTGMENIDIKLAEEE